jgi:transcriptional regulator with XRE-family HTH domain
MKVKKPNVVSQNPKDVLRKVGAKLVRLRKERGYTNSDDFAYDNGINRSQYGKYETGIPDIRLSTLIRITNAMGLTVEEFFGSGLDQK